MCVTGNKWSMPSSVPQDPVVATGFCQALAAAVSLQWAAGDGLSDVLQVLPTRIVRDRQRESSSVSFVMAGSVWLDDSVFVLS
jgi:hypothetical protein